MRHVAYKWFWAWDFEKEEKWLNKMSALGRQLVSVGFCKYVFEEGTPGEYSYRLELLENLPTHPESVAYIRFLEETGVEQIGSLLRWVYFRKKASEGSFNLYNDLDSRINHLKRISVLFLAVVPVNLFAFISNMESWIDKGVTANLVGSIISGICVSLLTFGFIKVMGKRKKLKKERVMHE